MATLVLSSSSNLSRPNGSAGNEMPESVSSNSMSWDNLIYIADFLWNSGQREISLRESESTRHPEGVDFILYLLERGFDVTFLTNGLLSPASLEEFERYLTATPRDRLTLVCHLHDPTQLPALPDDIRRLGSFLAVMGPWTQAGFMIDRLDFNLDFLFDYLNRFRLKRQLRLSLAHPVPDRQAGFSAGGDLRPIVERLFSYQHLFETYGVRLRFACGFPLCRFNDAELGWLHRSGGYCPRGCEPVITLAPDMSVYPCFPLSQDGGRSLFEFDSMEQIQGFYLQQRQAIKAETPGFDTECDGCRCREEKRCGGKGMCHLIGYSNSEASIGPTGGKIGISQYCLPR